MGFPVGLYYGLKYYNDGEEKIAEELGKILIPMTGVISLLSLIGFLIVVKICHKSIKDFLEVKKMSFNNILYAIALTITLSFFSISLTNLLVEFFPGYGQVSDSIADSFSSTWNQLLIIVLLPIFEEIFFRGIIFNEMRKRINITVAIIIQAIIFGAFHGNILQGIYTSILGIALALVYHWTRSIWAPIIIHVIYNFLGTMVVPILVYYTSYLLIPYLIVSAILTVVLLVAMSKRSVNKHSYPSNNSVVSTTVIEVNTDDFNF